jgi:hypothetical protein
MEVVDAVTVIWLTAPKSTPLTLTSVMGQLVLAGWMLMVTWLCPAGIETVLLIPPATQVPCTLGITMLDEQVQLVTTVVGAVRTKEMAPLTTCTLLPLTKTEET